MIWADCRHVASGLAPSRSAGATSGRTSRARPVSSSSSSARPRPDRDTIARNSAAIRSGLTAMTRWDIFWIAANVSRSSTKPNPAANRTARSIRRWSSPNRKAGEPIALTIPAAKSSRP